MSANWSNYTRLKDFLGTNALCYDGVILCSNPHKSILNQSFYIDGFLCVLLEVGTIKLTSDDALLHITAPAVIFFPKGAIVKEQYYSPDKKSTLLFLSNEYAEKVNLFANEERVNLLTQVLSFALSRKQLEENLYVLDTIRKALLCDKSYKDQYLAAAITIGLFDDDLQIKFHGVNNKTYSPITTQFLSDAHLYAIKHKDSSFYSNRICKSVSQLERVLKDETGKSIHGWLDYFRIEYCKVKILDSKLSIIAEDMGFSSPEYFSTYFKKHTGMTPREYRDSQKKHQK